MSGKDNRDKIIKLRVTQEEKAVLKSLAAKLGRTLSEYIRSQWFGWDSRKRSSKRPPAG